MTRPERAARAIWDNYSAIRAHFDRDAWIIGVATIINAVYSAEPEYIARAMNEGDGTYKP